LKSISKFIGGILFTRNKKPAELLRFSGPDFHECWFTFRTAPPPPRRARDGDGGGVREPT